jgi:hypothetical protein
MGREVRLVPEGFTWPVNKTWWGFVLPPVACQLCGGTGKAKPYTHMSRHGAKPYRSEYCPVCEGEGKVYPKIPVPEGIHYQMWETTSEGSPISPPFTTPQELARWLSDNDASACGSRGATYEGWLAMITQGWAPSMVISEKGVESGVEFVARTEGGDAGTKKA